MARGLVDPSLNFATGALQGFQAVDNFYARQHQMGLQDAANERAQTTHDLTVEKYKDSKEANRLQGIAHKLDNGMKLDADELGWVEQRFNIDIESALKPEFESAIETLKGATQDLSKVNTPATINAFNTVFSKELARGDNRLPNGDVIVDRRAKQLLPGKQPGTFVIGLEVVARKPDGTEYTYESQVTEGRSGDPDADPNIKQIRLEDAIKTIQGKSLLSKAFRQAKTQIEAAILERGGKLRKDDNKYGTTEIKTRNDKGEDVIETWVTKNGVPVKRLTDASRWSPDEGGGGGGSSATNLNGVEKMAFKYFGGKVDENGMMLFDDDSKRDDYAEATKLGQQYLAQGKAGTYGEAFAMAVEKITGRKPTKDQIEAIQEAEQEFEQNSEGLSLLGLELPLMERSTSDIPGLNDLSRDEYIEKRAPQIRQASIPNRQGANTDTVANPFNQGAAGDQGKEKPAGGGYYQFKGQNGKPLQIAREVFDSIPEGKARTFKSGPLAGRTFVKNKDGSVQEISL